MTQEGWWRDSDSSVADGRKRPDSRIRATAAKAFFAPPDSQWTSLALPGRAGLE